MHGRWPGALAGGGLAAATFLLLLAPASLGITPHHAVVMGAPYHGVVTGYSTGTSTSGCGLAKIVAAPHFSASTGMGVFAGRVAAPTCPHNPLGAYGTVNTGLATQIPIPIAHSTSTVVALASVVAVGSAHVKGASCSVGNVSFGSCYQYASSYFSGWAYILDKNTGAVWYSSNYFVGGSTYAYNYTFCYGASNPYNVTPGCSSYGTPSSTFSLNTTFSWQFNVTNANTSDQFVLTVSLGGSAYASTNAYSATMSGGSTSASYDVSSMGRGVQLASITII